MDCYFLPNVLAVLNPIGCNLLIFKSNSEFIVGKHSQQLYNTFAGE